MSIKNGSSLLAGNVYLLPMADGKKKILPAALQSSLNAAWNIWFVLCAVFYMRHLQFFSQIGFLVHFPVERLICLSLISKVKVIRM